MELNETGRLITLLSEFEVSFCKRDKKSCIYLMYQCEQCMHNGYDEQVKSENKKVALRSINQPIKETIHQLIRQTTFHSINQLYTRSNRLVPGVQKALSVLNQV